MWEDQPGAAVMKMAASPYGDILCGVEHLSRTRATTTNTALWKKARGAKMSDLYRGMFFSVKKQFKS
ncbi:MAG: hypothetical protein C0507_20765 [Cyanobacteria bacterium PR.3.49]|nr:hypothetical protein [Cyanobacteria bacterium PR.3.49]